MMYNNSKERGFILDKDAKRFVPIKMQYYQFGKVPSKCSCLSSLFNSVVGLTKTLLKKQILYEHFIMTFSRFSKDHLFRMSKNSCVPNAARCW